MRAFTGSPEQNASAVSATHFQVASNDSNRLLKTHSRTARLPRKEPASGQTVSRRRSGRVTGVARVTSQARNAGMRLWAGLMYPSPAQRRVIRVRSPMAPRDTPERGARPSRHRRPPMDSGGPEGVSKHPSLTQRMRICGCAAGAGYVSATAAAQTRIRTVYERRQMRTRRTAHRR